MKKLIVILMILIVGILACGCTSQSTAPATTVQTTAAPTPVPTTEVPTAVPTPEATTEVPTTVVTTVVTTAVPTPTPTPLPDVNVKVTGSHSISPSTITIPAGTKVIFSTDSIGSTFEVAIRKSTGGNDIAESGLITTKKSWSYTFKTPGKFYAADVLAPNNAGIIIVT